MRERLKWFWAAPVFEGDEEKTRAAAILNPLLVTLLILLVFGAIANLLLFANKVASGIALGAICLIVMGSRVAMMRGRLRFASALFVWGIWLPSLAVTLLSSLRSLLSVALVSTLVIAGLLLGRRATVWMAALTSLSVLILAIAGILGYSFPETLFPSPVQASWAVMTIGLVMTVLPLNIALRNLNDALTRSRQYAREVEEQRVRLAAVVEERTSDLERRTRYVRAASAMAEETAMLTVDLTRLLVRATEIIGETFGYYHTALYLLNDSGLWAELQAASGAGREMLLAQQYRVPVDVQSVVGLVAQSGTYRVALRAGAEAPFFNNPDLPAAHSELALPLRVGGQIIGVLDVQSVSLTEPWTEALTALQPLVDQLAVAINGVRLLQQVQAAADADRRAHGELTRTGWTQLLQSRPDLGFLGTRQGVVPAGDVWRSEMAAVLQSSRPVVAADDATRLAIPLRAGGQVIGVLGGQKANGWTTEEITLLEALVEQLDAAMERARLYQDTQRRAARERLLREVTAHVRSSSDPETVLTTLLREVGNVLGRATFVRLGSAEQLLQEAALPVPDGHEDGEATSASPVEGGR